MPYIIHRPSRRAHAVGNCGNLHVPREASDQVDAHRRHTELRGICCRSICLFVFEPRGRRRWGIGN